MKTQLLCMAALMLFLTGCTPLHKRVPSYFGLTQAHPSEPPKRVLTEEQARYLQKYCDIRASVLFSALLPRTATPEEVKPRLAAQYLGFKNNPTWEQILAHPFVNVMCTEERRKKFGRIFCDNENSTWLQILYGAEKMYKERGSYIFPKKEKGKAAPLVPPFSFYRSELTLGIF